MATIDPLTSDWSDLQVEVMHRLREWAASYTELNHHMAAWMGLPSSDAHALGLVIWAAEADAPLSPAELSRRIGMTSGATTVLLDRLESVGLVRRSRESTDRRRVTIRPEPQARERAHGFLLFAGTEFAATVAGTPDDELRVVASFLARMTAASTNGNERLTRRERGQDVRT
ncbi:MarR family winged helix-turn-helix transcriptional regulator [Solicola sp. PLA-1-18]|uniref:MarR family winged helix-turn-helix transcriptional regulator n=1 Tax=Solicola sp. PLA-1-18 TaxID=3380532 RepID=UPI003B7A1CA9